MKERAFTLVEALLTGFLLLLLLGVAALLLSDYARIMRGDERKQTMRNLMAGLERMSSEVRLAQQVSEPGGALASRLTFVRFQPAVAALPPGLPDPLPTSWNPRPSVSLMTVTYDLQGDRLMRTARAGGLTESELLASDCTGLAAQFLASGNLEVAVSYDESGAVRTLRSETALELP